MTPGTAWLIGCSGILAGILADMVSHRAIYGSGRRKTAWTVAIFATEFAGWWCGRTVHHTGAAVVCFGLVALSMTVGDPHLIPRTGAERQAAGMETVAFLVLFSLGVLGCIRFEVVPVCTWPERGRSVMFIGNSPVCPPGLPREDPRRPERTSGPGVINFGGAR